MGVKLGLKPRLVNGVPHSSSQWVRVGGYTHFAPKCGDTHFKSKFCEIKFATESTDRELLGRPAARYWATFVFLWYKNQFFETKFATESTDRELLGRPVARYSATFVFLCYKSQFSEIKFATQSTDRELLGRPVARYSATFVFYGVIHYGL